MNKNLLKNKKLLGIIVVLIIFFGVCIYFFQAEKNYKSEMILEGQVTEEQASDQANSQQEALEKTDEETASENMEDELPEGEQSKVDQSKVDQSKEVLPPDSQTSDESKIPEVVMCTPDKEIEAATETIILEDEDFVKVTDYIPTIYVDLKYATEDNFTSTVIYSFSDAYLRYGTVKKLILVQEILQENGYSLKIWDAFRPVAAQFALWEVYPDATYVADPNTGFSSHSRGNTLDVTLVLTDGSEVQMPTKFDDFSILADRDYSDVDQISSQNATLLETVMKEQGFNAYQGEWWHFSDNVKYSVDENFNP